MARRRSGGNSANLGVYFGELPPKLPPDGPDGVDPSRIRRDDYTTKNPAFLRDFGLYGIVLDEVLVEAAGIEPASASPPHTGDYMLSLSFI